MGKGTRGFAGLCRTQLRTGALCRQGLSAAQTLPGEPQGERWERRGAEEAGPLSTASKPTALQWDPDTRLSQWLVAWVSRLCQPYRYWDQVVRASSLGPPSSHGQARCQHTNRTCTRSRHLPPGRGSQPCLG